MNQTSLTFDSIVLGAGEWLWWAGLLALIMLVLILWSYLSSARMSALKLLAMLFKALAILALAFCLLEPMRRVERPRPGANVMALMVDNSRSMGVRSIGDSRSRAENVQAKLPLETEWQSRLAQDFDLRRYSFDDRLKAVDSWDDLSFDGNHSSLGSALVTLTERFSQRPVAGLMLFTDGIATDEVEQLTQQLPDFPVYPILRTEEGKIRDVSLSEPTVTVSSFELAPVTIEGTLRASGLEGEEITVRLMSASGETLERQTLKSDSDSFEQKVRFQFRPDEPGFQVVQLRAMLSREDKDEPQLESRREITTANNTRLITVDRGGGPYRILYVAGRPNWEFKFIRRALEEDVEIDLQALVRIAKKEPKFSFRDRGVDTANPLLAGFDEDEETAEQYDEPVLMTIGGQEGELKTGFPSVEDELFRYHAIVLDDVEAGFFSQQQMLLMRQFVAERGGGLMMLGGQESFSGGGYRDTPLGDLLPVYLSGAESRPGTRGEVVRYRLTREGALEPWLRLRDNQRDDAQRVQQMPDFQTWHAVNDVKPGAAVLANLETSDGNRPGLVSQRFGKGRTMALLVGDFWRWSMRRPSEDSDDLAQSWRQIARWLTGDVPKRIEVNTEPPTTAVDPYRVQVQLRDAAFKPLDNAEVKLVVTEPDGQQVEATASPDPDQSGTYVAEYWSRSDGGYQFEIQATGPDGELLEPLTSGWVAEPSAAEFAEVAVNRELLADLAAQTGGEIVDIENLDTFAASLPSKKIPITESKVEPLWHRPWIMLFAVACLCAEWGIRRWKGLP